MRQQFLDSLNFFDLLNVFEAHQRALHLEKTLSWRPLALIGGGGSGGSNQPNPTFSTRSINPSPTQIRGQPNVQRNKAALTSTPKFFKCVELENRMVDCHNGEKYGKGLIIGSEEEIDNTTIDFKKEPDFDGEERG